MPTYIFKNKKTEEVFELQMRISELDAYKADNPNFKQVPTAPNFRLKGTGWYETDFKTGNKKNIAKSDNDNPSTTKITKNNKTTPDKTVTSDSSN
jgi:predicted nucleic acid-binding Zn ribbon protein|tara:strand:- start:581 stop:865 length:285 start_codon:yes stop_codon:yes gene_type:complete